MCKAWNTWQEPIPCTYRRSGHASAIVGDTIYLFGGKSSDCQNDIVTYNIVKNEWVTIETNGKKPTARYGSTLVSYKQNLYKYGGCDNLQHFSDLFEFELSK